MHRRNVEDSPVIIFQAANTELIGGLIKDKIILQREKYINNTIPLEE